MKIGDKVILSAVGMEKYRDGSYNPHNALGEIDSNYDDDEFAFHVTWCNSETNVYKRDELQVIQC